MPRPRVNSQSQKELDKAEEQFEEFSNQCKDLASEVTDLPVQESEPQTRLSKKEVRKATDVYLKPKRTIFPSPHPKTGKIEEFNEKFRKDYEVKKTYVKFVAENREILGEAINLWTKPFSGMPAEEWDVPVNKPIWGPRYLYEKVKRCRYTRLIMDESPGQTQGDVTYYGKMVATNKIQRLDAYLVDEGVSGL